MIPPAPRPPVYAVHGFMFDPKDIGGSNDPAYFFQEMSGLLGRRVVGFSWYSAPFGFRIARPVKSVVTSLKSWLGAWGRGKLHPYRLAWDLAVKAGERLADQLRAVEGPVDIVAHSLGARVTLKALALLPPGKVRRVVFFNGAELVRNAEAHVAGLPPEPVTFLNIAVGSDQVLRLLGANFSGDKDGPCIGWAGVRAAPACWRDLFLDNAEVQRLADVGRAWTLRGNAPDDFLDHSESYRFAGNGDLARAWLAGDDLAELTGYHDA